MILFKEYLMEQENSDLEGSAKGERHFLCKIVTSRLESFQFFKF